MYLALAVDLNLKLTYVVGINPSRQTLLERKVPDGTSYRVFAMDSDDFTINVHEWYKSLGCSDEAAGAAMVAVGEKCTEVIKKGVCL